MALLIFIAGLPAAMSIPVLEAMDSIFGGVLLILGGLLITLLVGWVVPKRFRNDLQGSKTSTGLIHLMLFFLRWVSPVVITAGLLISVVDLWRQWFSAA
jgi:NSS family neurotransmitter:Na+ symporter